MGWSSIIGQERVKSLLKKTLQERRIANSYLFYGIEGIGKDALALEFAKVMNCNKQGDEACDECDSCIEANFLRHPNIQLVFALPVGDNEKSGDDPITSLSKAQVEDIREQIQLKAKDTYYHIEVRKANFIKINSIREVKRQAALSTRKKGKKVFIIFDAHKMNPEASNSLLKILEEPLSDTVFILTTSKKSQLLPTIISRTQMVRCDPLKEEEIANALLERDGVDEPTARLVAKLSNGSYSNARHFCTGKLIEIRNDVTGFMKLVLSKSRKTLIEKIEDLVTENERSEIREWLIVLESWLRDAMLLQQKHNLDLPEAMQKELESFVKNFPHADLISSINAVEKSIVHLDKNVYLQLIIINLAFELRRSIMETVEV